MVSALDGNAVVVAGATWVMRAILRGDRGDRTFVSLARIAQLHETAEDADGLRIGALVTHDALAKGMSAVPEALVQAAANSANPAIRRAATIGGNLCAQEFRAPDLVPALIALNATVTLVSGRGRETLPVEEFVNTRAERAPGAILTTIHVPRQVGRSAHARALLRQAGEYPVANASVSLNLAKDGTIDTLRIAVGAVEDVPRRWHSLERALQGQPLTASHAAGIARDHLREFTPRDDVDAPGWYRLRVLPGLVQQLIADIANQPQAGA